MSASSRPAWASEAVDHCLQLAAWQCRQELYQLSRSIMVRMLQELRQQPDRRPGPEGENRIGETP